MIPPETRYTKIGESSIAYQVMGDGPIDLGYVTGFIGNIESQWESRRVARILEPMSSYSRLIMFDRRGQGISDAVAFDALPTLEDWADDLRAVLDAAGSTRTAILARHDAGPWGILFAALHPERTAGLVFWNSYARSSNAEGYTIGVPDEETSASFAAVERLWGTPALAGLTDPSSEGEEGARWYAKYAPTSMTPSTAMATLRYIAHVDVRQVLPSVHVPTLVLHRRDSRLVPAALGRYLAEHIPGATYLEVPGQDVGLFGERADEIQDHIEQFLPGARRPVETDRVLATVLFTDIVDSTSLAVHIAARVMAEAGPGEVVCSRTVKDLVAGSEFTFEDRGLRALKGVPDEWQLYAVRRA